MTTGLFPRTAITRASMISATAIAITVIALVIIALIITTFATLIVALLIAGRIFAFIPVVSNEVDAFITGVVSATVTPPVLGVARWHIQVDRRTADRHTLDHPWLLVYELGWWVATIVKAPVKAGLADAYRNADISGKGWRGGCCSQQRHNQK